MDDKKAKYLLVFIIALILVISPVLSAETNDTLLCSNNENQTGACECDNHSSSPWGIRTVDINCQSRKFTITTFNWEVLPALSETLDISWNLFEYVPDLDSNTLKRLTASHNNVTALDDNNFNKLPQLRELDLSWNSIEVISVNAFIGLSHLQKLDISHNHLRKISFHVFSYLVALEEINLSWNQNLNDTFGLQDVDLFLGLGATPRLKTIRMNRCGLTSMDLSHGTNLTSIYLEWNNFTSIPTLPRGVTYLDMSGNPIEVIGTKFFPQMYQLETLMMEDMPQLREIGPYALYGLPALKKVSFQNSRSLKKINPEAFGPIQTGNETEQLALEELILRGAALETLNSSLSSVFRNLKTIDLAGLPLDCDCRVVWIKHLDIETGAQCHEPKILHGSKVSKMNFHEAECKSWPGWIQHTMHGLMLIVFLVVCSVGFYMLVVRLRPFHRSSMRKVGPSSPYAPITIEPNRAENHF